MCNFLEKMLCNGTIFEDARNNEIQAFFYPLMTVVHEYVVKSRSKSAQVCEKSEKRVFLGGCW